MVIECYWGKRGGNSIMYMYFRLHHIMIGLGWVWSYMWRFGYRYLMINVYVLSYLNISPGLLRIWTQTRVGALQSLRTCVCVRAHVLRTTLGLIHTAKKKTTSMCAFSGSLIPTGNTNGSPQARGIANLNVLLENLIFQTREPESLVAYLAWVSRVPTTTPMELQTEIQIGKGLLHHVELIIVESSLLYIMIGSIS